MKALLSLSLFVSIASGQYYETEAIPLPEGKAVEVGVIALLPEKKIAISGRGGAVWIGSGCYDDDLSKVSWTLFASGLGEPSGLFWRDEALWFQQQSGLVLLKDLNGDGKANDIEKRADTGDIPGVSQNQFVGSDPDTHGDCWAVIGVNSPVGSGNWPGWAVRMSKKGEMFPEIPGVRSPGGIGYNAVGDLFYTERRGLWNGSSSLKWLKPGGFMGSPVGSVSAKLAGQPEPPTPRSGSRIQIEREKDPRITPPAVVLPHARFGQLPTAVISDLSGGKFGPFEQQVFVGEQMNSQVQRVYLEMVNGLYQGAVFPFLDNLKSDVIPIRMAKDGTLFVGGVGRGSGGKSAFLERTRWNGKVPFEVETMRATPTGFVLNFTEKVDPSTAGNPGSYVMEAWTYIYQKRDGSPEVDQATPKITGAKVSEDGLSVELTVIGRVQGHVHHLNSKGVTSAKGAKLWHADVYYTLNEIPLFRRVEER